MTPEEKRLLWISLASCVHLRPLVVAGWVRAQGAPTEAAEGLRLRPSERAGLAGALTSTERAERIARECAAIGDRILTPEDGGWQALLWCQLPDPPACLFVRGSLHDPDAPAVAIVGARFPSSSGLAFARSLARDLASRGVSIVSGLALGIDGAAHRGALDAGGRTIAVLAGGLDLPTPPSHRDLAERVARAGALVSEFPHGTPPRPIHFPRRNRIIAALASVTVVVEGREHSGARSTVDHALALGRDVAAVPRDPLHEGSRLPNLLLQSGAAPVMSAADVLSILDWQGRRALRAGREPDPEAAVLALLDAPRDPAWLAAQLGRDADSILASLGRLELAGEVRRTPGMRFARVAERALP